MSDQIEQEESHGVFDEHDALFRLIAFLFLTCFGILERERERERA